MTTSYSFLTPCLGLMCIRGWVDPQTPLLFPSRLNGKFPGSSHFDHFHTLIHRGFPTNITAKFTYLLKENILGERRA